jgi:hypothetical protein
MSLSLSIPRAGPRGGGGGGLSQPSTTLNPTQPSQHQHKRKKKASQSSDSESDLDDNDNDTNWDRPSDRDIGGRSYAIPNKSRMSKSAGNNDKKTQQKKANDGEDDEDKPLNRHSRTLAVTGGGKSAHNGGDTDAASAKPVAKAAGGGAASAAVGAPPRKRVRKATDSTGGNKQESSAAAAAMAEENAALKRRLTELEAKYKETSNHLEQTTVRQLEKISCLVRTVWIGVRLCYLGYLTCVALCCIYVVRFVPRLRPNPFVCVTSVIQYCVSHVQLTWRDRVRVMLRVGKRHMDHRREVRQSLCRLHRIAVAVVVVVVNRCPSLVCINSMYPSYS